MTQISKIADLAIEMNNALNVIKHVLISYKTIDYNDNQLRIKHKKMFATLHGEPEKDRVLTSLETLCLRVKEYHIQYENTYQY